MIDGGMDVFCGMGDPLRLFIQYGIPELWT